MKGLFIIALVGIPWCVVACVVCACMGSIGWAFTSAGGIVLCLFVASREYDAIQEDRRWIDAKRHPRL